MLVTLHTCSRPPAEAVQLEGSWLAQLPMPAFGQLVGATVSALSSTKIYTPYTKKPKIRGDPSGEGWGTEPQAGFFNDRLWIAWETRSLNLFLRGFAVTFFFFLSFHRISMTHLKIFLLQHHSCSTSESWFSLSLSRTRTEVAGIVWVNLCLSGFPVGHFRC